MIVVNVIHNSSEIDRGRELVRQMARQGYDMNLWPAIEGNIAEAHKQIVRYAKKAKWSDVLIAEDDVFFYSGNGMDYFLSKKPQKYDLYLGGVYNHFNSLPNRESIVKRFSGLHLYMVNERFYDLFLSADCSGESIDNALSKLGYMGMGKFVCCYPYAAVQNELPSTNLKGVVYKHSRYFNKENTFGYE